MIIGCFILIALFSILLVKQCINIYHNNKNCKNNGIESIKSIPNLNVAKVNSGSVDSLVENLLIQSCLNNEQNNSEDNLNTIDDNYVNTMQDFCDNDINNPCSTMFSPTIDINDNFFGSDF